MRLPRSTHHEPFNTLKNQGDHFEHNFGHGYQHLSVVFAVLMMLAFLVDQVQQLCCPLFQAAWAKWGSKRLLWEKMSALFYDYALDSMQHLFEALVYGFKKSVPQLVMHFHASANNRISLRIPFSGFFIRIHKNNSLLILLICANLSHLRTNSELTQP